MPTVCVLLSSYNGGAFIREQIDSILNQEGVEVNLIVRDDCSTDNTPEILDHYQEKGLLQWYTGPNIKPARSFLTLLADAPEADYYAFSDQDDYWMADKLSAAVGMIGESDKPSLYFSQTQLADENLKPIESFTIHPILTFGESLVYYFVGGCTMVMNKKLRTLVNGYSPGELAMHDVWIYCVAQALGSDIHFDPTAHILYRQHSHNAVGQGYGILESWRRRMKRVFQHRHIRQNAAKELLNGYGGMLSGANLEIVQTAANYNMSLIARWKLLTDKRFRSSDRSTNLFFKSAVILGTF